MLMSEEEEKVKIKSKKTKKPNAAENQIWAVLVYFFHNIQWDNAKLRNFK